MTMVLNILAKKAGKCLFLLHFQGKSWAFSKKNLEKWGLRYGSYLKESISKGNWVAVLKISFFLIRKRNILHEKPYFMSTNGSIKEMMTS